MRRQEFNVAEQAEMTAFLEEMSFGYLATNGEDGCPRVKALNFVCVDGDVYMHGAKSGEKIQDLARDNRVTFAVAKEYAIIPSYFTDARLACPATAFFKSVTIRGRMEVVHDLDVKARAFTKFMEKLQPEGGYDPFDTNDADYVANLKAVALLKLVPEDISAKFKFGQNIKGEKREQVMAGLTERDGELDAETLALMKKFCPHHQGK